MATSSSSSWAWFCRSHSLILLLFSFVHSFWRYDIASSFFICLSLRKWNHLWLYPGPAKLGITRVQGSIGALRGRGIFFFLRWVCCVTYSGWQKIGQEITLVLLLPQTFIFSHVWLKIRRCIFCGIFLRHTAYGIIVYMHIVLRSKLIVHLIVHVNKTKFEW